MVQVIVGGDVLSPGTCRGVLTRFPRLRLLNGYGPTENGTTSTAQVVTLADCAGPIPIGRPTPNTTVYILDRNLAPTPVGKIGEIVAGGEGVALGYHKRPELTAERFLPDPFIPGGRMYRTGDLGLWRADGVIEFAGRMDDQVKIRGYRIELGEIEAALTLHPAVAEAAVIVREDVAGSKQLAAYISPRVVGVMPDLREHLRTVLPAYMLPSACMWLERMPLTANGKIDRKGLLALGKISGLHIEPWTATQIHLLTICRDLFQRQDIGLRDEFFAIGGTSLLAARLIERIEREMAVQLAPSVLIEATTVERLADAITRVGMPIGPDADPVVLNPDASGLPVVVLHGDLLGGGVYCRRLSTLLPDHQLLIFSPPLGHGTAHSSSIAAIAERIRTQLLATRPAGPFILVGFCIYGLVAWEVARQLQHSGHAVAEVVLLDAEALPGFYQNIHGLCAGFDRNPTQAQNRLLRWHHTILRLKDINRLTWLEKIHYVQRKCLGKMTARAPVDAEVYQASGVDIGTLANHLWIWAGYRPQPLDVRVRLITSDEGASPDSHLTHYWQKRATQTTCHHLGGRHLDLITEKLPEVSGFIARPS